MKYTAAGSARPLDSILAAGWAIRSWDVSMPLVELSRRKNAALTPGNVNLIVYTSKTHI